MVRLFDLHAASCAGDTLIAIGLAGTIFFNVPLGEARSKVALYLLVTMVPFALLAPVVGPLLDHFRHGRRYALATTMLGRAFLAWLISDYIHGFGLYPAAFGVLALSRAYGVARSAAVPRLLPDGLGLSQVGRPGQRLRHDRRRRGRADRAGGVLVRPAVAAAGRLGDLPGRHGDRAAPAAAGRLRSAGGRAPAAPRAAAAAADGRGPGDPSGRLVIATLVGSASFRALYGFLLLFLAFAIKAGDLHHRLLRPRPRRRAARWRWSAARSRSAPSWPPRSAPGCGSTARRRCSPAA